MITSKQLSECTPKFKTKENRVDNTCLFDNSSETNRTYIDLVIALWPTLTWRHAGFGALQAYVREGSTRETRVHLWHPDLVKPGIADSGLCHDHRFNMLSNVLVGQINQIEFELEDAEDGDWETYTVLHARKAMELGGGFHHHPRPTGTRYRRHPLTYVIHAGTGYTFNKFAFHETHAQGITVTLIEKAAQEEVDARILARRGIPLIHAFTETKPIEDCHAILAEGLGALRTAGGL